MSSSKPGAPRKRVNFNKQIDAAVLAAHGTHTTTYDARREQKREAKRVRSSGDVGFSYVCSVITKRHNGMESARNNPAAGAASNGYGRNAKKRKYLAKAHRG